MRILLMRHGTSEPREGGVDDPDRRLVSKGRKQAAAVAALLERADLEIEALLSSPLRRARETAEVLREEASHLPEIEIVAELEPGTFAEDAIAALLACPVDSLLAVGHEPLLSEVATALVGDERARIDLRKGGLVEIEVDRKRPGHGVLLGLLRPRYLR